MTTTYLETRFSSKFAKSLSATWLDEWAEEGDLHFTLGLGGGRLYLTYWNEVDPNDPGDTEMWATLWVDGKERWYVEGTIEHVESEVAKKFKD